MIVSLSFDSIIVLAIECCKYSSEDYTLTNSVLIKNANYNKKGSLPAILFSEREPLHL